MRALRERFPQVPIVADLKIMDGGYLEAEMMAKAGATHVVVMGRALLADPDFVRRMEALEGRDGILSVSVAHGFGWGDTADTATRVLVVADDDATGLAELAGLRVLELETHLFGDHFTAGQDLLRVLVRAGDAPDFSSLEARLRETQAEVRALFNRLIGGAGD